MANTVVNISLKSKDSPSVNITTLSGGEIVSGVNALPLIKFIPTGAAGPTGATGAPGTASIGDGEITHVHLAADSVGSSEIINGSVGYNEIANSAVRGSKIQSEAITTEKILDGAVTQAKLANNSVGVAQIIDGTVTRELLADSIINGNKLEDNSILTSKIANNQILTSKLADRNVTGIKIASNPDLDGEVKANNLKLKGSSPATLTGPDSHALQIKSNTTIDFQNTSNTTIASLDQSGNLTISGTVDGRDLAVDGAKLDGISDGEILDWSVSQTANIHADNIITSFIVDEDDMSSNSTSLVPSQQSVKAYVDNEVSSIVDSAPGTLNTLNELADALGDDENFSTTVTNNIATKQPILSEGAFANGDKTKLDGIATGATASPDLTVDGAGTVHANNYTNTTYDTMGSGNSYAAGLVPAGDSSHGAQFLRKDGAWVTPPDTNTTYVEATSSYMGLMSSAHHDKLDGIADGAEVNVQSDWNSSSGDSQILNKPTIPADLTSDGAGTIHVNNVPTLNQDTTGNATTATNLTAGDKTIAGKITAKGLFVDANVTVTPSGDGVAVHVDAMDITDNNTSASGTATTYNHITFENPRLLASNSSVTTTDASTVYIKGAPVAHTNQTITNAWALKVANGTSYFSGAITANGGVTGDLTGNADTATNLVASTSTAVQLGTIELGHASDTTIARTAAGTVAIEGNTIATTNKWIDCKTAGYWASTTTGGFYITLGGSGNAENVSLSTAHYQQMYVAPYDGKILRISSFHQSSTSGTSTFEMYIDGDDSDLVNDQRGSDMTTSSYTRKFTEDCPADWTFSKGEAIAIKRTDSTARYGVTMTIVFEYDTTT